MSFAVSSSTTSLIAIKSPNEDNGSAVRALINAIDVPDNSSLFIL